MKMIPKTYLILSCLVSAFLQGNGQAKTPADKNALPAPEYKARIKLITKAYGDSIVLRWAPSAGWAWSSLNAAGYRIERVDLSEANHPVREILTAQPLKPLSLEQFKNSFERNNQYAAIAAQCLYGKNFTTNLRKGQGGIADQSSVSNNRYAFALQVADYDARVAGAEGLRYCDKKVRKNGVYIYRVFAASATRPGKVDTASVLVENGSRPTAAKPKLSALIPGDGISELHWGRAQAEMYSGYIIERSPDGLHFSPLTHTPFFASKPDSSLLHKDTTQARLFALLQQQQVYVDSLPGNYTPYSYRIRGINAFAEWSDYSDTLTAMGRDLTPPVAVSQQNPQFIGGRRMRLQWKKQVKEADLKGYYISRAKNINGPYYTLTDQLIGPSATDFTDTAAFEHGQNFYVIVAVDTANNLGPSLPAMGLVPDVTPPASPLGLHGYIERNGLVHLSWKANEEEDIKGYKVYFANSAGQAFTQITLTPCSDTTFTDSITLKTLTKKIWYKIAAVDQNNNHSAFSAALLLKKPDLVPPVPPLAKKVFVDSAGVLISFIQSSSEDVVKYIVYRKKDKEQWMPVREIRRDAGKNEFECRDSILQPFIRYQYCAEAVDEDSLHSGKSTTVIVVVNTIPKLPAIGKFTAVYDAKNKMVRISWQYEEKGSFFFLLYKGLKDKPLLRFRSVNAEVSSYGDPVMSNGKDTYQYAIQAISVNGRGQSPLSRPAEITITE